MKDLTQQESAPSKTNKKNVSMKNKRLLAAGQNTFQNSTTTRSTDTPAFVHARNLPMTMTTRFYVKKQRQEYEH